VEETLIQLCFIVSEFTKEYWWSQPIILVVIIGLMGWRTGAWKKKLETASKNEINKLRDEFKTTGKKKADDDDTDEEEQFFQEVSKMSPVDKIVAIFTRALSFSPEEWRVVLNKPTPHVVQGEEKFICDKQGYENLSFIKPPKSATLTKFFVGDNDVSSAMKGNDLHHKAVALRADILANAEHERLSKIAEVFNPNKTTEMSGEEQVVADQLFEAAMRCLKTHKFVLKDRHGEHVLESSWDGCILSFQSEGQYAAVWVQKTATLCSRFCLSDFLNSEQHDKISEQCSKIAMAHEAYQLAMCQTFDHFLKSSLIKVEA
jgi:hypothetical protein